MDRAVFDSVECEIDDEVKARFPIGVIEQAVRLHHGDDPEIEPGELWSGSSCQSVGPRTRRAEPPHLRGADGDPGGGIGREIGGYVRASTMDRSHTR